jgi:hypothetical protein
MATTKELIKALLQADPTGEKEVIVSANDGWGYSISTYIKLADVIKGEIYYDSENPTCVIIDAE